MIKSESVSDIVCFGYMHKWCKESEVRELEQTIIDYRDEIAMKNTIIENMTFDLNAKI